MPHQGQLADSCTNQSKLSCFGDWHAVSVAESTIVSVGPGVHSVQVGKGDHYLGATVSLQLFHTANLL